MNKRKIQTYVLWHDGLSFGISTMFFLSGLGNTPLFLYIFILGYMLIPLLLVGLTVLVAILFPGVTLELGMKNDLSTIDAITSAEMNDSL